ncbi:hypothetical protein PN441_00860 [Spirulina major CS-329]|uniref:hypothetical protein n=1 Tax=Spirulina TaxID=1154 RepID=UPI00232B2C55|nr:MULTISPECIES: hypothetical protein [Spirulina]MDB9496171.1 hypothetical protein [Spirulina subsalsa CS-330]MDB9501603.1 hypothetical protein [Spirulina major CS-329]
MFGFNATKKQWQWMGAMLIAVLGQGLLLDVAGAEAVKAMDEASHAIQLAQTTQLEPESMSASSLLQDGIHAYGAATQRDQLAQDYLVFTVDEGQVRGAIYRPRSEYACFTGQVTADALELAIAIPDHPDASSYAIALDTPPTEVAGKVQRQVTLQGFHAFTTVSDLEQSLLEACASN